VSLLGIEAGGFGVDEELAHPGLCYLRYF